MQYANAENYTFAKNGAALRTRVINTNSINDPTGAPPSNLTDNDLTTRSQSTDSPPGGTWVWWTELLDGADHPDQIWIAADGHDFSRSPRQIRVRKQPDRDTNGLSLATGDALFTTVLAESNPYVAGQYIKFNLPAY